jgi:hypothetical protein
METIVVKRGMWGWYIVYDGILVYAMVIAIGFVWFRV